jgi:nucleotide-binding universal stress UspA family protein
MMTLKTILVATDFGEAADTALEYGRELARTFGAALHVVHVADDLSVRVMPAMGVPYNLSQLQADLEAADRASLERLTAADRRELHVTTTQITAGGPAREIVKYAREAHVDLIVMGTHGRGAVEHFFMGSVAERVVRSAPCPVLTVRHPEHEFIRPDALERRASV